MDAGICGLSRNQNVNKKTNGVIDMDYCSVAEMAKKWGLSERSVRNYCAQNRVPGAFIKGKTWYIPVDAVRPGKPRNQSGSNQLLKRLREEKQDHYAGGIYHKTQIELTYNSNHIEGSRLTHAQTRFIFETNTVGVEDNAINVDDIIETTNHFRCVDLIIDKAGKVLTEKFIKELHSILKTGTSDARKDWFVVGDYKKLPNEVGGRPTTSPEQVADDMYELIKRYTEKASVSFDDILDFHVQFERIHPFQDGNGRVGRLIMFKECLKHNIVPFIIGDDMKMYYYRGLAEWDHINGYLTDTCLFAQDRYKAYLDYFRIPYV